MAAGLGPQLKRKPLGGVWTAVSMTLSPLLLKGIAAVLVYGGFLWAGYQRRRGIWTSRSWRLFALTLLLSFAAAGVAVRMGYGVDQGIYEGMSPGARKAYFYTMFALLLTGTGGSVGLMLWFAKGRPDRQFGLRKRDAA